MDHTTVAPLYEEIAQITSQMLVAAKDKNWKRMKELETGCAVLINKIKLTNENVVPFGPAYQRKITSIKKIMANDLEIRSMAEPWMAKIDGLMQSAEGQQLPLRRYR